MVYNKVFKRGRTEEQEQSNTVGKWNEILLCLVSHRLPCCHGGCTNISEFVLESKRAVSYMGASPINITENYTKLFN